MFILFLLLIPILSDGQIISIDKTDTSKSYSKIGVWSGSFSTGIEVDKQYNSVYDASTFIDLSLKKNKRFYIFSASERFTLTNLSDLVNIGYIHIRIRQNYIERGHFETFNQANWNQPIGLSIRFVNGLNYRYSLLHKMEKELVVASGVMLEYESWNYNGTINPIDTNIYRKLFKSNTYIKYEGRIFKNGNLALSFFYQSRFDKFFRPRILSDINVDFDISDHFSIGFKYWATYDSRPVVPIFRYYHNISNNIIYKF